MAKPTDDSARNVQTPVTPNGRCTRWDYDTAYDQLPAHRRDFIRDAGSGVRAGDCVVGAGRALITAYQYDRGFGLLSSVVTPADEATTITFDPYGRTSAVYQQSRDFPGIT